LNLPHIKKSLGQNFLNNRNIAAIESEYGRNRNVIEIGPGRGILTEELCKRAKSVLAVEKDSSLYEELLSSLAYEPNLTLLNMDFFEFDIDASKYEIIISNIPYNLSSKTLKWLADNHKEALLCVQKEFAERLTAKPGERNYSKLSVFAQLNFSVYKIMKVKRGSFYPVPKVDSEIIYLKPVKNKVSASEYRILDLIMEHKKKILKNAILDSQKNLGLTQERIAQVMRILNEDNNLKGIDLSKTKVFKINPEALLKISQFINQYLEL